MRPSPFLTRALPCAAFAVLAASACNDGTGPEPLGPGLHVVSAAAADSALAPVADLVVEVRGPDGAPLTGAVVQFRDVGRGAAPFVYLSRPNAPARYTTADTADAQGRASTPVILGHLAGTARVAVTVEAAGYQDTVAFTVRPGALDSILILPADTALYAGATYRPTVTAADRWGNPRADAVTLGTATPAVAAVEGTQVRGVAIGRGVVTASAGTIRDSAYLSVVPNGTLVMRDLRPTSTPPRRDFVVMNLDGSEVRSIFLDGSPQNLGGNYPDVGPEWIPGRDEIAFYDGYPRLRLWAVNLQGQVRPLFTTSTGTGVDLGGPRFSRDGAWVYFNWSAPGQYMNQVWRARPDGTAAERLTSGTPVHYASDLNATASPDGGRIVYGTDRVRGSGLAPPYDLMVMELATRQVRPLGVIGSFPQWSPVHERIAYERDHRIWVAGADGTGERAVTPAGARYEPRVSWSPDGEWIAATASGPFIHLIHVDGGMVLPLAFTGYFQDPAWRP